MDRVWLARVRICYCGIYQLRKGTLHNKNMLWILNCEIAMTGIWISLKLRETEAA